MFSCKQLLVLSAALLLAQTQASMAQLPLTTTEAVPAFSDSGRSPDIKGIPVFDKMIEAGAKLYYMGERSGLYGWLIVQGGQIQMVYMPPDRKSILIGALFTDSGELVTSHQIKALSAKNADVAKIMDGSAMQQIDITRANATEGGIASVDAAPVQAEAGPPLVMPALPTTPGERLMSDLQAASGVVLGENQQAPELLMVVSPDCIHCKRSWAELRDVVKSGKLKVRLIPISRDSVSDETQKAAVLLRAPNSFETWDKYASGSAEVLAGTADPTAVRAIIANREITDRWNILGTPYLLYRSKDGKIKIVQGKPERMAAVLTDLIQ